MKFEHIVPIPTDKRLNDVRVWLNENIGPAEDTWTITVDLEVVNYFKGKYSPLANVDIGAQSNGKFFVISFKNEEDKVKFILTFL